MVFRRVGHRYVLLTSHITQQAQRPIYSPPSYTACSYFVLEMLSLWQKKGFTATTERSPSVLTSASNGYGRLGDTMLNNQPRHIPTTSTTLTRRMWTKSDMLRSAMMILLRLFPWCMRSLIIPVLWVKLHPIGFGTSLPFWMAKSTRGCWICQASVSGKNSNKLEKLNELNPTKRKWLTPIEHVTSSSVSFQQKIATVNVVYPNLKKCELSCVEV